MHVNEQVVAEGRIDKTVPFIFAADETLDVGIDDAAPVTDDYPSGDANRFTGQINWVRIDLEEDDVSHLEPDSRQDGLVVSIWIARQHADISSAPPVEAAS